jgi:hypothetical protein
MTPTKRTNRAKEYTLTPKFEEYVGASDQIQK